ncbi:hypothetical protein DJ55_3738 [Yersinia pseudotuberculosis]|nr:hypothetical protein DJ55_3738 [Yersinia pseudotuberculosis]
MTVNHIGLSATKKGPVGPFRLLTNPDDAILNGEDRQRSKASAPRMARLEPTWMYLRRLYDLPVLSVAGTLSIT